MLKIKILISQFFWIIEDCYWHVYRLFKNDEKLSYLHKLTKWKFLVNNKKMELCLFMCTYFNIMWMYFSPAIYHRRFFLFLVWHRSDDPSPAKVNRLRNPMCHLAGFRSTGGIYKPIPSGSSCRIYRSSPGKKDWSGWTYSSPATLDTRKFVSFSFNIRVSEKNRAGSKYRY